MGQSAGPRSYGGDGLRGDSGVRFGLIGRAVAAFVLVIAGWFSLTPLQPPERVTGDSHGFSVDRAMADVRAVAGAPRPTGSNAHSRVRAYLLSEIRRAGLTAEVHEAVVPAGDPPRTHRLTRVRNVIGRLPGTGGGKAILLASHYDSVPMSPGAADDAAGVAALLETMRVMAAGEPPRRDVIFLFTDAEELGLHGARAFVDAGRAEKAGWVLNFEARGASGASVMFETLPGDVSAMRFFADTSPKAAASSYSYDIYRHMPNDTDFSVFREVIPAGFNFAFIEDPSAYHASVDTPERLSRGSLRHHGVQALALARRLAEAPPGGNGSRAVYFSLPVFGLVVYPAGWDKAAAAGCAVLGLVVLVVGLWGRRLIPGRLLAGLAVLAVAMGGSVLGLTGLQWLWDDGMGLAQHTKGVLEPLAYGFLSLAAGIAALVATAAGRRIGALNVAAAAALLWTALGAGAAWLLGASAFLFTWPVLFAWIGLLIAVTRVRATRWRSPAVLMCAVPAVLIWVPTLKSVAVALGPDAMILGLVTALPVLLLTVQLAQLTGPGAGRWSLPAVALIIGGAVFGWVASSAGPSPSHPRSNSLVYAMDARAGEAYWASYDDSPDDWTRRVLGDPERRPLPAFFTDELELLTAPAPAMAYQPPVVNVVSNEATSAGGRRLVLDLRSARGAPLLEVAVRSKAGVMSASIDGQSLAVNGDFRLTYHAVPRNGVRLTLETAGRDPVDVSVVDGSFGLPEAFGPGARPPELQPRRYPWAVRDRKFPFSDLTLVRAHRRVTAPGGQP